MIHHIVFFELKPEVDAGTLEELVRHSRSLMLRIPEVLHVRSGRNVDPDSPWPFFFSIEVESLEKLRAVLDDPFHLKFLEKFVRPHTCSNLTLDFELDPSKPLKYS